MESYKVHHLHYLIPMAIRLETNIHFNNLTVILDGELDIW